MLCIYVYLLNKYVFGAYYVLKISLWSRGAPGTPSLNVFLFSLTEEVTFYQTQLFGLFKKS